MSDRTYAQVVEESQGKMEYVKLGNSGMYVSKICLGMMSYGDKKALPWVLEEKESIEVIEAAYKCGINFFDTANVYSGGASEVITGKAIKQLNMNRDEIVVATKLFNYVPRDLEKTAGWTKQAMAKTGRGNQYGLSRKHIFAAVEASLKRLDLDYVDLLQIHRFDPETPVEETMEALHDVIKSGKVRYIGASSMWATQFQEMQSVVKANGWTQFITMQDFYCASYREEEREMLRYCKKTGVASIPWSPLGGGFLARPVDGKGITSRGDKAPERSAGEIAVNKAVEAIAKAKGVPMAQVALAWVFANPVVAAPIVGVSAPRSLHDAIESISIKLTAEEKKQIDDAYLPRAITGHF